MALNPRLKLSMLPNLLTPWGEAWWCEVKVEPHKYYGHHRFFGAYLTLGVKYAEEPVGRNCIVGIMEERVEPHLAERVCRISTMPEPVDAIHDYRVTEVPLPRKQPVPVEKIMHQIQEDLLFVNKFSPIELVAYADRLFIPKKRAE